MIDILEVGDCPVFQINGLSKARMIAALNLAPGGPAIGYTIDKTEVSPGRYVARLVLFGYKSEKMTAFPGKASPEFLAEFIQLWLQNVPDEDWDYEPDHDGSNKRGWKMYTQSWGHIEDYGFPAYLAIEPAWILYGK